MPETTAGGLAELESLARLHFMRDDLRRAVGSEDVKTLTRVPGIGQKGAQRIILELKDRLGSPLGAVRAAHAVPAEVRLYDHLFVRPDPGTGGRDLLDDMRRRADGYGRTLRFGYRVHVVVRPTDDEARAAARHLVAGPARRPGAGP